MNGVPSHFVYIDYRSCGEPFYVGKGNAARIKVTDRNRHHTNVVSSDANWKREIVAGPVFEAEAFSLEKTLIAKIGRRDLKTGPLVNFTDGGEGESGRVLSGEHKRKIGDACKNPSEESRKKMSKASKGRVPSAETKAKMSSAKKGRVFSDEHRAKLSAAKKGKVFSDEHRANLSIANKKRTTSEETRLKLSIAQKAHFANKRLVLSNALGVADSGTVSEHQPMNLGVSK